MTERALRPIVFLDFDDVIFLGQPGQLSGYQVIAQNPPQEQWSKFFHSPATDVLSEVLTEHDAKVVLTTSWLRFMMRDGFERLFSKTGLNLVGARLHASWEAPQNRSETRAQAIEKWLGSHHRGEPYVILDDELSGTGLSKVVYRRSGRVILCEQGVGLHRGHLPAMRAALSRGCN